MQVDDEVHVSLLAAATVAPGDPLRFGIEPGRLHLFDVDTSRPSPRCSGRLTREVAAD